MMNRCMAKRIKVSRDKQNRPFQMLAYARYELNRFNTEAAPRKLLTSVYYDPKAHQRIIIDLK